MTVSFEKYKKKEWQENPILAQVKEMQRELDHLKSVLAAIETKALAVSAIRMTTQMAGADNVSFVFMQHEVETLRGWIDSLIESEIGLHAMTMPNLAWTAAFVLARKAFMEEQMLKWHMLSSAQNLALRRLGTTLLGKTS